MSSQRGSVLSEKLIKAACASPPPGHGPLISNDETRCYKPAAYDMRIAPDGIVLPDGRMIRPGEPKYQGPLIILPGQTAFVSTYEQLDMPDNLSARISIKGTMAREGILLLTGAVVDPGWRVRSESQPSNEATGRDGRLHFALANLGRDPVAIQPEFTKVVTIQFSYVAEPTVARTVSDADDIWADRPKHGLGFIEDLAALRKQVSDHAAVLERQERATNVVIVGAIFLLAVTILGVVLSFIIGAAADAKLATDVKTAIPKTGGERAFVLAVLFGTAWSLASLSRLLISRRLVMRVEPSFDPQRRREVEAVRALEWKRARARALIACGVSALVVGMIEGAMAVSLPAKDWWVIGLAFVFLVALCIGVAGLAPGPISDSAVAEQEQALADVAPPDDKPPQTAGASAPQPQSTQGEPDAPKPDASGPSAGEGATTPVE